MQYLGIDTSNYTTSAALYDSEKGTVVQQKMPLPVEKGARGLRQSDAVFHHTVQLPQVLERLLRDRPVHLDGVGVSVFPRRAEGSYMPCFLAGKSAAKAISLACSIPCFEVSHQEGHIAAALYSADAFSLLRAPFLAFHVSGGTTEALLVTPHKSRIFEVRCVARSLDLHAGQAIDRVGVMLGLAFPCGPALENLAAQSTRTFSVKPTMKGVDCCLSGVENRCQAMFSNGEPAADIAKFCIESIRTALEGMLLALLREYGNLPILFSGGVSSNRTLQSYFSENYGAKFAEPAFSADNAAGVAVLAALYHKGCESHAV